MQNFSLQNLKTYFDKYESELSAGTLVFGFILDFLTLNRIDQIWDNIFIILYLFIAGASILALNLYEDGKLRNKFMETIYEFLPFTLQFAFGGLFSAFTIFYFKSSSLISGGVFVLILFLLLVGNEFFKKRYEKLVFQVSLYFIALFSFSIFFLPVLLKKMGAWVFLGSGALSLVLVGGFIVLVSYEAPERYKESYLRLFWAIGGIYLAINFLYFTNIIPPIPLSLKVGEVYHLVEKQASGYRVVGEGGGRWYEIWQMKDVIHLNPGEPAYVFSSVFAPTDLAIPIIHDWQYFDEKEEEWRGASRIEFPIRGGRDEGYRGFSMKENVFPGKWRVDIKTERGQIIGRVRFDIEEGSPETELTIEVI